ncbi:hypothetical protein OIU74_018959 [Salix koriyanagi]|uniref:Uncharacterized protein n=1 Tax=Salix koriyanagi TaxID=2511006 RepID=A0A9Q0WSX4_9ROSI|nr:hypothetical protein OIU74_018959 [Salix koriyanagi]
MLLVAIRWVTSSCIRIGSAKPDLLGDVAESYNPEFQQILQFRQEICCSPVNLSRRRRPQRNMSLLDGSQRSMHEIVPNYKLPESSYVLWFGLLQQRRGKKG